MRSNLLLEFRKRIAEINDNFCHYTLIWQQFYIDNEKTLKIRPNEFTANVYSNNAFASSFNVPLKYLDSSH